MNGVKIGEPCPKCATLLIRRAKRIVMRAGGPGDVAYCAHCNAAYDEIEPQAAIAAFRQPLTA